MDKLKCKPVMLLGGGPIWKLPDGFLDIRQLSKSGSNYQHLYLVSDREVRDWYWNPITGTIHRGGEGEFDKMFKNVEATTNPAAGLPLIPDSFIQQWVEKQGKIEWVYLAMGESGPSTVEHIPNYDALLSSQENPRRVIILPTKDSFTREEAKAIAHAAGLRMRTWSHDAGDLTPPEQVINEWFDQNF